MPYAQTSLRAEKRALREKMRDMGLSRHAIAGELARPSGCAPPALAPRNPAPLRSHPAVAPGGRTLAPPGPRLTVLSRPGCLICNATSARTPGFRTLIPDLVRTKQAFSRRECTKSGISEAGRDNLSARKVPVVHKWLLAHPEVLANRSWSPSCGRPSRSVPDLVDQLQVRRDAGPASQVEPPHPPATVVTRKAPQ